MSKDFTKELLGKVIQVDRNGPESSIGKLLHVGDDYIAILTNEGVVYYNSHHNKSFTENVKGDRKINAEVPKGFKKSCNLKELIKSSQYEWLQINRGPETVEGVLASLEDDFVVLVNCGEMIRVALFHIKNVRFSYMDKSVNNQSSSSSISDESSSSSSSDESSSSSDESSFRPSHLS
ncbi:hypothetical protein [Neobacillus cucumis]|uniref:hypothetical protein n=1 Tax=Neobacillus cucumis TaxID=1740721 RepID=UPI001966827F|nr:hypothetical protein [Neobacillus cucumis]MBM7655229.1 spore coat protein B [Neobacillus cucumis]